MTGKLKTWVDYKLGHIKRAKTRNLSQMFMLTLCASMTRLHRYDWFNGMLNSSSMIDLNKNSTEFNKLPVDPFFKGNIWRF
jgi:hypothetical protein